jgi:hypothetical protein
LKMSKNSTKKVDFAPYMYETSCRPYILERSARKAS